MEQFRLHEPKTFRLGAARVQPRNQARKIVIVVRFGQHAAHHAIGQFRDEAAIPRYAGLTEQVHALGLRKDVGERVLQAALHVGQCFEYFDRLDEPRAIGQAVVVSRPLPRPVDQRDQRIEPVPEAVGNRDRLQAPGQFVGVVIRPESAVEEGDDLFVDAGGGGFGVHRQRR